MPFFSYLLVPSCIFKPFLCAIALFKNYGALRMISRLYTAYAICDQVLYLLYESLSILISGGTTLQYFLKNAMQETGSQFNFRR